MDNSGAVTFGYKLHVEQTISPNTRVADIIGIHNSYSYVVLVVPIHCLWFTLYRFAVVRTRMNYWANVRSGEVQQAVAGEIPYNSYFQVFR